MAETVEKLISCPYGSKSGLDGLAYGPEVAAGGRLLACWPVVLALEQ